MESTISISEILGTIDDGRAEICATADAAYDPARSEVTIALDAFARRIAVAGDGHRVPEAWIPPHEKVTEHIEREEAVSFARDVFRSWIRKVRSSVPHDLHLRS
jgi:hypothetical protein